MSYASTTTVPAERTQAEIRKTLERYKASAFAFAESNSVAQVQFEMQSRRIKFTFSKPVRGVFKNSKRHIASQDQVNQENRRLWRCLLLSIKSKLECVESGISTFEEEFLSHIVLANGQTMGDVAIPQIASSYERNEMPALLGYSK